MELIAKIVNSYKALTIFAKGSISDIPLDSEYASAKDIKNFPYKHTTWIPRWNYAETVVSTSFQRGIHVVCL